jgi:CheY-like chemotaxis protein
MQEEQPLRGFVVLVVDDDTDNRETAAAMIESLGCSVLRAATSEEALAILD